MSRTRLLSVAAIVAVAAVTIASCSSGGGTKVPTTLVRELSVTEAISATGAVEAKSTWPFKAPASGKVVELFVENGATVTEGQPILRIDSPQVQQLRQQADQIGAATSGLSGLGDLGGDFDLDSLGFGDLGKQLGTFQALLGGIGGRLDQVDGQSSKLSRLLLQMPASSASQVAPLNSNVRQANTLLGQLAARRALQHQELAVLQQTVDAASQVSAIFEQIAAQQAAMNTTITGLNSEVGRSRQSLGRLRGQTAQLSSTLKGLSDLAGSFGSFELPSFSLPDFGGSFGGIGDFASQLRQMADQQEEALNVKAPATGTIVFGTPSGGGGMDLGALSSFVDTSQFSALTGGASQPGVELQVNSEIGSGQQLFTVYDLSGFRISADIDESQVYKLEKGKPAEVRLDQVGTDVINGTVTWVSPVGESHGANSPTTYPAEITLDLTDDLLKILKVGMTANVDVVLRKVGPGAAVRQPAILNDETSKKASVFVVTDGKAVKTPVTVIGSDGINAIVKGVKVGDRVVVSAKTVKDGQSVVFDKSDV